MSNKNFKNQNRRNYNQYANKEESTPVEEKEEVVTTIDADETEEVEEMTEVTEAVEEEVSEDVPEDAPSRYGVVNCAKLNIRKGPSKNSNSLCIVESGSELEIEHFNDEWFKVVTQEGVSGYCMRKFVDEK